MTADLISRFDGLFTLTEKLNDTLAQTVAQQIHATRLADFVPVWVPPPEPLTADSPSGGPENRSYEETDPGAPASDQAWADLRAYLGAHPSSALEPGDSTSASRIRIFVRPRRPTEDTAGATEFDDPIDTFSVLHWVASIATKSDSQAEHCIQRWLTGRHRLRQGLLFLDLSDMCASLNQQFYDSAVVSVGVSRRGVDRRLSVDDVMQLIRATLKDVKSTPLSIQSGSTSVTHGVFHALRWQRRIQTTWSVQSGVAKRQVRPLSDLELGTLRARLFGAQTGVDGLTQVLRGGILPRPGRGRVWVVAGEPGSAKTSLALQLACDMAERGRIACFLSLEEDYLMLLERMVALGMYRENAFDIVPQDQLERVLQERAAHRANNAAGASEERDVRGMLVLIGNQAAPGAAEQSRESAPTSLLDQLQRIHILLQENGATRWRSFIIDSIEALQTGDETHSDQRDRNDDAPVPSRRFFATLVGKIEDLGYWGILLSGLYTPELQALSYLADTVIHLGVDEARGRWFEMTKCRTQAFDAGKHPMSLRGGRGLRVYPNLQSTQRVIRHTRTLGPDTEYGIPLPTALQVGLEGDRRKIREGSSVLLWGPAQCGKSSIALRLLSEHATRGNAESTAIIHDRTADAAPTKHQTVLEQPPIGASILFSFRTSEREYDLRLRSVTSGSGLERVRSALPQLQVRWIAPGENLTGAHLAAKLASRILRSRQRGAPVERIIFEGVEAIEVNLPNVHADKSFWPTVISLLAAEHVTCFYLVNDDDGRSEFVRRHWFDMDYVISVTNTDVPLKRSGSTVEPMGPGDAQGAPAGTDAKRARPAPPPPARKPSHFRIEKDPSKLASVARHGVDFDPRQL